MALKKIVSLMCLVSLLASIMVAGSSCGGSKSNGAAKQMMKKLPENTDSFIYIDLEAFRADDTLAPGLEDLLGSAEDMEGWFGIDLDNAKGFTGGTMGKEEDAEMVVLLSGRFDLAKAREALEDLGCDKDTYRSVEVWEAFGYYDIALMTNMVMFGSPDDVNACIDVIRGSDSSLYDNEEMRDILDCLPEGVLVGVGEGSEFLNNDETEYEGLQIAGMSAGKGSDGKISCSGIFKFENEEAASAAIDEVEANAGDEEGVSNVKVRQDGQLLEASYDQDADNFFADEAS